MLVEEENQGPIFLELPQLENSPRNLDLCETYSLKDVEATFRNTND